MPSVADVSDGEMPQVSHVPETVLLSSPPTHSKSSGHSLHDKHHFTLSLTAHLHPVGGWLHGISLHQRKRARESLQLSLVFFFASAPNCFEAVFIHLFIYL